MFRFLMMFIAFIFSFGMLFMFELLPLNQLTTLDMMNKLSIVFVPTHYVFSIYLLLLPALFMWMIRFHQSFHILSKRTARNRMILFYTILLFMVMTSIFWHYELLIYMITTSILLIIANMLLYFTYHRSERSAFDRNPISLLFGWHIFLTMYLCNYTLTIFEWNGWGISEELWAVIFLTITTAIGLHFLYHYGDFSLNFAIMWGFVHVALSNGLDSLFVTVAALFLTFAIVSCYFIFKHLKAHDNLKTSVL